MVLALLRLKYKYNLEAGCDEAGRGCLAGPVFAAAVILPTDFRDRELNDSKQLSEKKREKLRLVIEQNAISWSVASVDNERIDKINILNASIEAMHLAVSRLSVLPDFLLIDGNRFHPYPGIRHRCFVKGDATWKNIAAASILAKTHRDDYMMDLHDKYPFYHWNKNKGYPTKKHRSVIQDIGTTPYHRLSFRLTDPQIRLF